MERTFEAGMAFGHITMIVSVARRDAMLATDLLNGVLDTGANTAPELKAAAEWCRVQAQDLGDDVNARLFDSIATFLQSTMYATQRDLDLLGYGPGGVNVT